jgi:hypothetical protein
MTFRYNPFEISTGSGRLTRPLFVLLLLSFAGLSALIIGKAGLLAGLALLALPFILGYSFVLLREPLTGLYTAIVLGFLLLGIARYIPGVQVGLAMDGILILTYIGLIFNRFKNRVDWRPAKKDITLLATVWFGYSIVQLANPEMQSLAAYISGFRGISLYMFLMVPLVLLLFDSNRKIEVFFYIWGVLSILATLKGFMQLTFGVDRWEQAWLDGGGAVTHVLFGKLRIFSFMSDAGQFGANQGYSAVVAAILAMGEENVKKKVFYIVVAITGFYGMMISGTRGALIVPLTGFALYFILRKNKAVMISGAILMVVVFIFFKYTTIGQGNYQIRRMRTAFDPNDASLQVRLENQRILSAYLATRPLGGGIGHGGVKAQRYLPNAYLSQVATDSWYVLIWAEQGIIGLLLHLFILFYVIIKSSFLIMFRIRDPILRTRMAALASGFFGVMVASYGNAVLGSMPTSMLIYTSMALMLNAKAFDQDNLDMQPQSSLSATKHVSTMKSIQ